MPRSVLAVLPPRRVVARPHPRQHRRVVLPAVRRLKVRVGHELVEERAALQLRGEQHRHDEDDDVGEEVDPERVVVEAHHPLATTVTVLAHAQPDQAQQALANLLIYIDKNTFVYRTRMNI